MQKFGIDVSTWQKGFGFTQAKNEGVEFAIIRGGFTGYGKSKSQAKDDQFENHYKNAKINGLGVGCYFFSRACSKEEGEKEAKFLYENCLKDKQFEYPIYIDVEDTYYQAKAGKQAVTDGIIGFCEYLENKGYYVGIYANTNWFNNYMYLDQLKAYDKWIAQWSTNRPDSPEGGMWQFGGETNYIRSNKVAGVTCDQNYAYKDYPSIIKNAGLNGFAKNTENKPVEPEPTTQKFKIGDEVIINGSLYKSANADDASGSVSNKTTKITRYIAGTKHPYNTTGDLGWMNESDIQLKQSSYTTYTVQKGDTLIGIGNKLGKNWKRIASDNGIAAPKYTIYTGQVLKIY